MKLNRMIVATGVAVACLAGCASLNLGGSRSVVQVDVAAVLNARVVMTAVQGEVNPADHAVDRGNSTLITGEAARERAGAPLVTLPDDALFPATARHPAVQLHFASTSGKPQVHRSGPGAETYSFAVPPRRYAQMQLFFLSGNGATPLALRLHYADGTVSARQTRAEDWFNPAGPDNALWFNLAAGFGKTDRDGKMLEVDHHYIHGYNVNPDPEKKLARIEIEKQNSPSTLNFFGATGDTNKTWLVPASGR